MSKQGLGLDAFWERLAAAESRLLLLDYDGTLAPFRVERDQAVPYEGVREILKTIMEDGTTRLVIVSGRAVKDVTPLLGLEKSPEVWGCHGWERLFSDGRFEVGVLEPAVEKALGEARLWIESSGLRAQSEFKSVSVTVHWRGVSEQRRAELERGAREAWEPLVVFGLELHPFDGGLELRCPGKTKGDAVNQVLSEAGEGVVVAYLGDDLTDEDAFRALKGRGLGVLMRSEYRQSSADVWLRPPEDLLAFLRLWRKGAKEQHKTNLEEIIS